MGSLFAVLMRESRTKGLEIVVVNWGKLSRMVSYCYAAASTTKLTLGKVVKMYTIHIYSHCNCSNLIGVTVNTSNLISLLEMHINNKWCRVPGRKNVPNNNVLLVAMCT